MINSSFLRFSTLLFAFCSLLLVGCAESTDEGAGKDKADVGQFADVVYQNARVYTVIGDNPWSEAIAIQNGTILAIGENEQIAKLIGPNTQSFDSKGKMLMPGIHDTHSHPVDAGLTALYECSFLSDDLSEVLEIVRGCVAEKEPGQSILGGQWNDNLFANGKRPRDILDEISTDHPIFFMDWSLHNAWVNSKALEVLGIDKNTADPDGGVIVRNLQTGEATGILLDNAAYNARTSLRKYTQEQYAAVISWSIDQMVEYGVTTYRDAMTTEESLAAYVDLDQKGLLKNRVKTSLSWKSAWAYSHESEIETIDNRSNYTSEFLDTDFAKIMLDGIPPTYTAALIEPYVASERFGENYTGETRLEAAELNKDVIQLDAKGLTVKIHATGDRAVRMALDAFEAARKANGDSGLMHEISHAALIHADDIARFEELNVAPEMCPIIWYPAALGDMRPILGEGRHQLWQMNTLNESGALVIYGSDWPVIPRPNPWPGIESMVTRMDPSGVDPAVGWVEEAVDLETAIEIFTINSAIANKDGDSSGTLEVGKKADFILLDRNIFEVPIADVSETQVVLTVVDGKPVYGSLK